uniref:Uncharacterized protein n=1 Tax=Oryza meridionalis TaxID=40149 RepID=A0A0E0F8I1_9ORYZ
MIQSSRENPDCSATTARKGREEIIRRSSILVDLISINQNSEGSTERGAADPSESSRLQSK